MLLCDGCDKGWHMFCVRPPVKVVPKGDWFCPDCVRYEEEVENTQCEVCSLRTDGDKMLLCDACDRGWHTYCADPPLKAIPKGDWFCGKCDSTIAIMDSKSKQKGKRPASGVGAGHKGNKRLSKEK
eukprot:466628-Prorocentrum_minimum.AAC.1